MPLQDDSVQTSYFPPPPPAEVYGHVHNPADLTDGSDEEEGHDIYRGQPPTPAPPRSVSSATSSSSSSSSSASVFGGRLGAISAGLEHAIARWARAWISSSSLSSSSSASVVTQSKSQTTRRPKKRPRSIATTIHNERSEREIVARIRARENLRTIPRGFVLYAPKLSIQYNGTRSQAAAERKAHRAAAQDPMLRTTSLEEVTTRMNAVLKERAKARRVRIEPPTASTSGKSFRPSRPLSPPHQDYMLADDSTVARSASTIPARTEAKGKQKVPPLHVPQAPTPVHTPLPQPDKLGSQRVPRAWWLDVSSPTWEDICAIGKLLYLHPLTLEDILTQDPREKLELFPKLGYYFLSFRAIESQKTRERLRNILSEDTINAIGEGIVGEVNVYLVVFREGICSFHFADIEEHVDRVRHRITLLGESANMSSEWIAHGLMDSIVDSFFPYLEVIEKEVAEIEHLVFSVGDGTGWSKESQSLTAASEQAASEPNSLLLQEKEKPEFAVMDEKQSTVDLPKTSNIVSKPRFSSPANFPLLVRRARRNLYEAFASIPRFKTIDRRSPDAHHSTTTVYRMARIRRLVTSLTRFLAVKSEVVAQVRKRLLTHGEWSLSTGTDDDIDIFAYMGDVQDHILTLQQSLTHYERMLSQSHPTYLSQLRMAVSKAKVGSDKAVVAVTCISMGVLLLQTLIGLVSMNCNVPHNDLEGNRYDVFAIIIVLAVFIVIVYSYLVRYWWTQAKRRGLKFG